MFLVAVGSAGWFRTNLPNHAAAARAIETGDAEAARIAMGQVLGFTRLKLSNRRAAAPNGKRSAGGRRKGGLRRKRQEASVPA